MTNVRTFLPHTAKKIVKKKKKKEIAIKFICKGLKPQKVVCKANLMNQSINLKFHTRFKILNTQRKLLMENWYLRLRPLILISKSSLKSRQNSMKNHLNGFVVNTKTLFTSVHVQLHLLRLNIVISIMEKQSSKLFKLINYYLCSYF